MEMYGVLKDKQVVFVSRDDYEWQSADDRRVAMTRNGEVLVSTVFLPLNHGFENEPLWFESMAFGADGAEIDSDRYETYEQALEGHKAMCNKVFVLDADTIE